MRKPKRKAPRNPPAVHMVQCPTCREWFAAVRQKFGLWWLPPHAVPGERGGLVVYHDGSYCTHSTWCLGSAQPIWTPGRRKEMSHAAN